MAYFSFMPTINIEFDIKNNIELRKVTDITIDTRFKNDVLNDITLFDTYDIKDGETPEKVSERFYGTPNYHWVLMLLNERYDSNNDWPMSSIQFERYMASQYSKVNYTAVHHYRDINQRPIINIETYYDPYSVGQNISCDLTNNSNIITSTTAGAFGPFLADINAEYSVDGQGLNVTTKIIQFLDSSTAVLLEPIGVTQQTIMTFRRMINPIKGAIAITNYEYESFVNEEKRRIKILHPNMMQQVLSQFEQLVNG